jgi:pSer/pThr/pTyr-binding forkhead associated (FHA) protein
VLEFPSRTAPRTRATHVIVDGVAHAIGEGGLALGTSPPAESRGLALGGDGVARHHCTLRTADGEAVVEDHSSEGTYVNGERVRGRAALRIGDRVRVGTLELLAVAVEDAH